MFRVIIAITTAVVMAGACGPADPPSLPPDGGWKGDGMVASDKATTDAGGSREGLTDGASHPDLGAQCPAITKKQILCQVGDWHEVCSPPPDLGGHPEKG